MLFIQSQLKGDSVQSIYNNNNLKKTMDCVRSQHESAGEHATSFEPLNFNVKLKVTHLEITVMGRRSYFKWK